MFYRKPLLPIFVLGAVILPVACSQEAAPPEIEPAVEQASAPDTGTAAANMPVAEAPVAESPDVPDEAPARVPVEEAPVEVLVEEATAAELLAEEESPVAPPAEEEPTESQPEPPVAESATATEEVEPDEMPAASINIIPGLEKTILRAGTGREAVAGDLVEVHYTGWLFDANAANGRGEKFDSSVDRGERFQFPLGEGRVIQGWDEGVRGMRVGELSEFRIAPDLAYGDRGAGAVIPPGSTLIFEIELFGPE